MRPALCLDQAMIWENWIGRRAENSDWLTPSILARFCATLDQPASAEAAPQGIHWCLCLPDAPTAILGPDGHPLREESEDSFMPPVPMPRRMWAASDIKFLSPIHSGAQIRKSSSIASIKEKTGSSGHLMFVDVTHDSYADDVHAVSETQSIVFREAAAPSSAAPAPAAPTATTPPDLSEWQWHREILPSSALLFRYSALTFNSHRIHYDLPYTRDEEGYAGLVVHGPLTATLLMDLAQRHLGVNGMKSFKMRAQSPAFVDQPLHLVGKEKSAEEGGGYALAALGPDGRTVMAATVT